MIDITNHFWKWKEDLMVNLLTFQPPILTCIEPDLNLIPFMKDLKRPHSIYISPKCSDLQIKPINHARTFDWVLTGMKMKIKLLFTEKDTFREKFEKKKKRYLYAVLFYYFCRFYQWEQSASDRWHSGQEVCDRPEALLLLWDLRDVWTQRRTGVPRWYVSYVYPNHSKLITLSRHMVLRI